MLTFCLACTLDSMTRPRYLGKKARHPIKAVDLLKWNGGPTRITLTATEFTTLCPVTNQPDFGRLTIEYVPKRSIVETKSLKLYLWSWREKHVFNEVAVETIAKELYQQISPLWLRVSGRFNARGGIIVEAVSERNEEFGDARLRQSIRGFGAGSAAELLTSLRQEVERFTGHARQHDDMTWLIAHVKD